jgi:hypothetical protein
VSPRHGDYRLSGRSAISFFCGQLRGPHAREGATFARYRESDSLHPEFERNAAIAIFRVVVVGYNRIGKVQSSLAPIGAFTLQIALIGGDVDCVTLVDIHRVLLKSP